MMQFDAPLVILAGFNDIEILLSKKIHVISNIYLVSMVFTWYLYKTVFELALLFEAYHYGT